MVFFPFLSGRPIVSLYLQNDAPHLVPWPFNLHVHVVFYCMMLVLCYYRRCSLCIHPITFTFCFSFVFSERGTIILRGQHAKHNSSEFSKLMLISTAVKILAWKQCTWSVYVAIIWIVSMVLWHFPHHYIQTNQASLSHVTQVRWLSS